MALVMSGIIQTALASGSLTLTPESNQSFRIKKIWVTGATNSPVWATITIAQATVGYFRVDAGKWNMLGSIFAGKFYNNVLHELWEKKQFKGYPVGTGQTFTITLSAGTADIFVEYDWFGPSDVKTTEQDGSDATERLMFLYGNNSAVIAAPNYGSIDNPANVAGTFKWPFSAGFPAAYAGQLISMFVQPVSVNTYAASANTYVNTQYVRLSFNQEVLFDLSKNGLPCIGSGAAAGSANTVYGSGENVLAWPRDDENSKLWYFDPVIPFSAGDELDIQVSAVSATAGTELAVNTVNVGLILLTKKVK